MQRFAQRVSNAITTQPHRKMFWPFFQFSFGWIDYCQIKMLCPCVANLLFIRSDFESRDERKCLKRVNYQQMGQKLIKKFHSNIFRHTIENFHFSSQENVTILRWKLLNSASRKKKFGTCSEFSCFIEQKWLLIFSCVRCINRTDNAKCIWSIHCVHEHLYHELQTVLLFFFICTNNFMVAMQQRKTWT